MDTLPPIIIHVKSVLFALYTYRYGRIYGYFNTHSHISTKFHKLVVICIIDPTYVDLCEKENGLQVESTTNHRLPITRKYPMNSTNAFTLDSTSIGTPDYINILDV